MVSRAHTCVVMEDGTIDIQAAVVAQELNGPGLEAVIVGEVAVQHRDAGCVGKYCSGCRLCVAHKSDILKCYVAVLQNDGPLPILHETGEQGVFNDSTDAIQVKDSLRKRIVQVEVHTWVATPTCQRYRGQSVQCTAV